MEKVLSAEVLTRFAPSKIEDLLFLSPIDKLRELLVEESQTPKNVELNEDDPNDIYLAPKQNGKKQLMGAEEDETEEKKKHYRPGVFALFYEINEGTLDKDAEVWYYREGKDTVGPVSSYNMDKLVYYHKISEETRVAFKSFDKFVRFAKVKKIVLEHKGHDI